MILVVIAILAWCIGRLFLLFFSKQPGKCTLPAGPTPLPLIGNLHQIDFEAPHVTMLKWKRIYGPVFTVWLPKPNVVIADYDTLKEAMIRQGDTFSGRYLGYVYGIFTKHRKDGNGIILCQKERWHEQKRFTLQVFRNFGVGRNVMERKVSNQTALLVDHLKSHLTVSNSTVDLEPAITLCVGNIIYGMLMGRQFDYDDPDFDRLKRLFEQTMKLVAGSQLQLIDTYPWLRHFLPTYRQYTDGGFKIQRYIVEEIGRHSQQLDEHREPTNYIDCYLKEIERRKSNGLSMEHFDVETLTINIGDLWAGGMETTVSTIRWAILYLLHYPDVQECIHTELDTILNGNPVRMSDRPHLHFTVATLNEVQRIVNVLPWNIQHCALTDTSLNGLFIPENTTIMTQFAAIHIDPDVFPQPFEFRPQRFLDRFGKLKKLEQFNPFGMGRRACLGERLARTELTLIFATLLQQFHFDCDRNRLPSLKPIVGMTALPQTYECSVTIR